jgi:cyanophycin synthetase
MNLGTTRALRGPNIWSQRTVLEVEIDLTAHTHRSAQDIDSICVRARSFFGNRSRSNAGDDDAANEGHLPKLKLAELLARVMVDLQQLAGCPVKFARVSELKNSGSCKVAVQYFEEPVGRMALEVAADLVRAAIAEQPFDVNAKVGEIRSLDQQIRLGPSTGSIVRAAIARGIPARRLNERSLVQLGYGCKQHRILAAETDRTSAVAESIVQDKELTKQLLDAVGVPVPKGRQVNSPDDAWQAALEIGVPVVIKPKDGNQGRVI